MKYTDTHEEMALKEQHGIQLRIATDELERGIDYFDDGTQVALLLAEVLLQDILRAVGH